MALPVFDLHCDTADRLAWQSLPADLRASCGSDFYGPGDEGDPAGCRNLASNRGHVSLEKIGAVAWAQCFACFMPDELSPTDAVRFCDHVMGYLRAQVAANEGRVALAGRADRIRDVLAGGRVAAVLTLENARLFAANLGLVERLADEGLLMASLSWNAAGPLASGHDTHGHLTSLGVSALAEMERAGVVLDVSHLNDECFDDVVARSGRPFVASHSNARAVCGHPRNLTDRQFLQIRERGGVVGLNYCRGFIVEGCWDQGPARVTFEDVAAHVEHWLDLGGEDVIALGGDYDGSDVPAFLDGADTMPAFQGLLVERFGETVAAKLCGENALAFFERASHGYVSKV